MAGYSGTPLAQKLGLKPGFRVRTTDAPAHYARLLAPLPEGLQLSTRLSDELDVWHAFVTSKRELAALLPRTLKAIRPAGAIWISWPKQASKRPTDVTEDVIRELALPLGLVDVKVCAVDEVWSGLKLVIRKERRG
jgi:hypothetical protein